MQSLSDDERKAVLGEVMIDELKAIREYVSDIPEIKRDVAVLKEDVRILKLDMQAVKIAIKDLSQQAFRVEARVDILEATA